MCSEWRSPACIEYIKDQLAKMSADLHKCIDGELRWLGSQAFQTCAEKQDPHHFLTQESLFNLEKRYFGGAQERAVVGVCKTLEQRLAIFDESERQTMSVCPDLLA